MNDILDGFRALTESEKEEHFESSTLKFVLKQLGMAASTADRLQTDLGPDFVFQHLDSYSVPFVVRSARCFSYNMLRAVFDNQTKPIWELWDRIDWPRSELPRHLIFKCFEVGRLVLSDRLPVGNHVTFVRGEERVYCSPFAKFFTINYGSPLNDN